MYLSVLFARWLSQLITKMALLFCPPILEMDVQYLYVNILYLFTHFYFHFHLSNICLKAFFKKKTFLILSFSTLWNWTVNRCKGDNKSLKVNASKLTAIDQGDQSRD